MGAVPWGASACPNCNFQFDQEYWSEEAADLGLDLPSSEDDDLWNRRVEIEEVLEDLPGNLMWSDIYGSDECYQCTHCGTSRCDVYVDFLDIFHNLVDESQLPDPAPEICDDFEQSSYNFDSQDVN